MNKVSKCCLIVAAVVIGLILLAFLMVNLYVQSASMQTRIEQHLQQQIGLPVKIARTSFTPWGGLQISGITVAESSGGLNLLTIKSFSAHVKWWPLLHRKVIVTQAVVNAPRLTWQQNDKGAWELPAYNQSAPTTTSPLANQKPAKQKPATSPHHPATAPRKNLPHSKPPAASHSFIVQIKEFQIRHGDFAFLDRKGNTIARLAGVTALIPKASAEQVSGTIISRKTSIADTVFPENLTTEFSWKNHTLKFKNISAELANGDLAGKFQIEPEAKSAPFQAVLNCQNVDVNRLIEEAGGTHDQVHGILSASLQLSGAIRNRKAITGSGYLQIANGEIEQYPLFQIIGQALHIDELVQLNLKKATANFQIHGEKIWINPLLLESQNLKITAKGTVGFNEHLDLKAKLFIAKKIYRRLPHFIKNNFAKIPNSNEHMIAFDVTGTLQDPRTNLGQHMLGNKLLKEGKSLMHMLFGHPKIEKQGKP